MRTDSDYDVSSGHWQDMLRGKSHRAVGRVFADTFKLASGAVLVVTRVSDRERHTFLLAKDRRLILKDCFRTVPLPTTPWFPCFPTLIDGEPAWTESSGTMPPDAQTAAGGRDG